MMLLCFRVLLQKFEVCYHEDVRLKRKNNGTIVSIWELVEQKFCLKILVFEYYINYFTQYILSDYTILCNQNARWYGLAWITCKSSLKFFVLLFEFQFMFYQSQLVRISIIILLLDSHFIKTNKQTNKQIYIYIYIYIYQLVYIVNHFKD